MNVDACIGVHQGSRVGVKILHAIFSHTCCVKEILQRPILAQDWPLQYSFTQQAGGPCRCNIFFYAAAGPAGAAAGFLLRSRPQGCLPVLKESLRNSPQGRAGQPDWPLQYSFYAAAGLPGRCNIFLRSSRPGRAAAIFLLRSICCILKNMLQRWTYVK